MALLQKRTDKSGHVGLFGVLCDEQRTLLETRVFCGNLRFLWKYRYIVEIMSFVEIYVFCGNTRLFVPFVEI